ncbi:tetratricopeptide repeat protein [Pseudomonas sp. MAP12]|uniref:Tetratricopeptide repeat protein n=1 Tax=Geopseudomonas aromaticivorans TaxID=2849492 RepID=A0ABS6MTU6_9GAMM|nr:tetratricopeptide repeat protein [Pseudomonas aromaticivorans]MBV2132175.1 tetratricopeptide repeat protein [Pseudomonas aromaticivorans]
MMKNKTLSKAALWPGLLIWAACTALAASAAERPESPVVSALVESASRDLAAGRTELAAATLERAQRIEPSNPVIVHYLGQVRLREGNFQQAEALAAKSDVLSGGDRTLRERNVWLTNAAREAAVQGLPPVESADDEQVALQQQLDEEIEKRQQAEARAAALRERLSEEQARSSQRRWSRDAEYEDEPEEPGMQAAVLDTTQEADIYRIPRGHRPPPGQCRIWFPGRSPGKQPPSGDCRQLRQRVPAGAWLIGS